MYSEDQEKTKPSNTPPWPVVNRHNIGENYAPGDRIKVRCIAPHGIYYNFERRREGDVFELIPMWITMIDPKTNKPIKENGEFKKKLVSAKDQFSTETMEEVEPETPESFSTAQQTINKKNEEMKAKK